jgi:hypothetical protein
MLLACHCEGCSAGAGRNQNESLRVLCASRALTRSVSVTSVLLTPKMYASCANFCGAVWLRRRRAVLSLF